MAAHRKIAILLHETDAYPQASGHFIWAMRDVWLEQGHSVEVLKGLDKTLDADLVIPHVDATVLPRDYADYLRNYRYVVNRDVVDISKGHISGNLLSASDSWAGPVIVKTNLNCGGAPDVDFSGAKIFLATKHTRSIWRSLFNRKRRKTTDDWTKVNCMKCEDYPVFASLREVPPAIFSNPSLVVERFLPECEKGIYYLRIYQFFGDRGYCARLGSTHPIVKQANIVSREEVPIPDDVMQVRRRLRMDYGKLDFVLHNGRVIVFDANRTPGRIKPEERRRANAKRLAEGLESFFSP